MACCGDRSSCVCVCVCVVVVVWVWCVGVVVWWGWCGVCVCVCVWGINGKSGQLLKAQTLATNYILYTKLEKKFEKLMG